MIWSCDLRANERPKKNMKRGQTDKQETDWHRDSMKASAKRANALKSWIQIIFWGVQKFIYTYIFFSVVKNLIFMKLLFWSHWNRLKGPRITTLQTCRHGPLFIFPKNKRWKRLLFKAYIWNLLVHFWQASLRFFFIFFLMSSGWTPAITLSMPPAPCLNFYTLSHILAKQGLNPELKWRFGL